jgi:hypothetical protein
MSLREKSLKVHFVFTDTRPTNDVLEFAMLINAFNRQGVICSYEDPFKEQVSFDKLGYKLNEGILRRSYTKYWDYNDFIIVQKIHKGRPNWTVKKAWWRTWVILKKLDKMVIRDKHLRTKMYLVDNQKVFDNPIYKERFNEKFSLFVSFGFDPKVLTINKSKQKNNTMLIDNTSFGYQSIKYFNNLSNAGWSVKKLAHHRSDPFKYKSTYEKAKVLIVSSKIGSINYPILYAMAYGVLIIKVGKGSVNHLNKYNCITCKSLEDAYLVMIRYNNDNSIYDDKIQNGYQYFSITQNIDKNAKHIIDSVCRFMYL